MGRAGNWRVLTSYNLFSFSTSLYQTRMTTQEPHAPKTIITLQKQFFFEVFLKIIPDLFLHSYTDSKDQNLVKSGAGQKEWIGMGSWRREERGQLAATNYHTELGWCKTAASEHNVWWAQWAEQVDNHVPDTDMFVCGGLALPKISLTSWPR